MVADGLFFLWVRAATEDEAVSIRMPLTRRYLNSMVPSLGEISLVRFPEPGAKKKSMRPIQLHSENAADDLQTANAPPQLFPMDLEVSWGTPIPVSFLEAPESSEPVLLAIRSRISAVLNVFFARKFDSEGGVIALLYGSAILFLLVETIAVTIGVSITRTVTAAVHNLYEGTQRVQEGDFSHRITVKGQDQVADLSRSFNRMTENLERLLAVAKESERIQAELEIAREVQTQLYPKQVPEMRGLRVTARWQPARMVSGDYFDYQGLDGDRLALAVGDVAGKGISAALLMATVQSCFRTQINSCVEAAAAGGNGSTRISVSPSGIVSQLNRQLFAFTTPEKYATFFFGLYEDRTGTFTYTNAGHLPPILIRGGEPQLLEVNGMVVGAFPFAAYGESSVILQPGDLLVFYTDGITEPQNEYGEMFGENRMIETIARQASLESDAIIASVLESVERWTGSPELQDDQTLIIARRQ
jgi:sigma-B regulation protein RsbU (phosphoserine phosphatase)